MISVLSTDEHRRDQSSRTWQSSMGPAGPALTEFGTSLGGPPHPPHGLRLKPNAFRCVHDPNSTQFLTHTHTHTQTCMSPCPAPKVLISDQRLVSLSFRASGFSAGAALPHVLAYTVESGWLSRASHGLILSAHTHTHTPSLGAPSCFRNRVGGNNASGMLQLESTGIQLPVAETWSVLTTTSNLRAGPATMILITICPQSSGGSLHDETRHNGDSVR